MQSNAESKTINSKDAAENAIRRAPERENVVADQPIPWLQTKAETFQNRIQYAQFRYVYFYPHHQQ